MFMRKFNIFLENKENRRFVNIFQLSFEFFCENPLYFLKNFRLFRTKTAPSLRNQLL